VGRRLRIECAKEGILSKDNQEKVFLEPPREPIRKEGGKKLLQCRPETWGVEGSRNLKSEKHHEERLCSWEEKGPRHWRVGVGGHILL